ncbi:hypothetical protein NDU88_011427 [Pleurodeles waltl]|uniref:Uncharacterized protein n=1 Tax=Pleurodeles waltl TaxID=8319 RepID=A0AAV7R0Z1_PLEWA|nr:hypothetical protein NDU88_011427 [Pleurodeles waltl]
MPTGPPTSTEGRLTPVANSLVEFLVTFYGPVNFVQLLFWDEVWFWTLEPEGLRTVIVREPRNPASEVSRGLPGYLLYVRERASRIHSCLDTRLSTGAGGPGNPTLCFKDATLLPVSGRNLIEGSRSLVSTAVLTFMLHGASLCLPWARIKRSV